MLAAGSFSILAALIVVDQQLLRLELETDKIPVESLDYKVGFHGRS